MLTIIVVVVFFIGLIMFLTNWKKIKQAVKEGWEEGKKKNDGYEMIKEDRTCDLECEGCEYEEDKRCLDIVLKTVEAKVVVIETREVGDTINAN